MLLSTLVARLKIIRGCMNRTSFFILTNIFPFSPDILSDGNTLNSSNLTLFYSIKQALTCPNESCPVRLHDYCLKKKFSQRKVTVSHSPPLVLLPIYLLVLMEERLLSK